MYRALTWRPDSELSTIWLTLLGSCCTVITVDDSGTLSVPSRVHSVKKPVADYSNRACLANEAGFSDGPELSPDCAGVVFISQAGVLAVSLHSCNMQRGVTLTV